MNQVKLSYRSNSISTSPGVYTRVLPQSQLYIYGKHWTDFKNSSIEIIAYNRSTAGELTTALRPAYNRSTAGLQPLYGELTTALRRAYNRSTPSLQPLYGELTTALRRAYNRSTPSLQPLYGELTTALQQAYNRSTASIELIYLIELMLTYRAK